MFYDKVMSFLVTGAKFNFLEIISNATVIFLKKRYAAITPSVTHTLIYLSIYIPWPFPPVWGVADNTKETTKTKGVSLRSSSNDEGSSRVWMALLG